MMPNHLGRYRLVRKLGQGGMGTVYEAVQEGLERRVAVKVLFPHWTHNRDFVERFQREARAAAALHHPNIVTIYDIGEDQGLHFFSMALVEGESLDRRVKREGKLPVSEALKLIVQAVQGLAHAWNRGILHRDIKPANLIVSKDGELTIADFGLAKALTAEAMAVTQTGQSLGTPYYMSPEQGANAKDIDFLADEYSLGATFYHLVTGKVPFDGSSPIEVAVKAVTTPLPPVRSVNPEVPPTVAGVIEKMLSRHKEDRYGTVPELVDALRSLTQSAGGAVAKEATTKDLASVQRDPTVKTKPDKAQSAASSPAPSAAPAASAPALDGPKRASAGASGPTNRVAAPVRLLGAPAVGKKAARMKLEHVYRLLAILSLIAFFGVGLATGLVVAYLGIEREKARHVPPKPAAVSNSAAAVPLTDERLSANTERLPPKPDLNADAAEGPPTPNAPGRQ